MYLRHGANRKEQGKKEQNETTVYSRFAGCNSYLPICVARRKGQERGWLNSKSGDPSIHSQTIDYHRNVKDLLPLFGSLVRLGALPNPPKSSFVPDSGVKPMLPRIPV